jgi:hypothetical protein
MPCQNQKEPLSGLCIHPHYGEAAICCPDLSAARDLDTVMDIVRHSVRDLTGSDVATFVLREIIFATYAKKMPSPHYGKETDSLWRHVSVDGEC